MTMKRFVSKGPLKFYYLRISLEFEKDQSAPDICSSELRQLIAASLKNLFGEVGASIPVDILKYSPPARRAILRVPQRGFSKLRSALCLYGKHGDRCCAFRIQQVSAHLMALAFDTRQYHLLKRNDQ